MPHQIPAGVEAVHHGETADWGAMLAQGSRDHRTGPDRRARMAGVGLDDHRAAGSERTGGVPAGDREREREVAGREDRHGPDRDKHPAQVGARRG